MLITQMEQIAQLPNQKMRAKIHYRGGGVENRSIRRSDDGKSFAIYARRSRTRGYWCYSFDREIAGIEPVFPTPISEAQRWQKTWQRALRMLEESGLWIDLQEDIKTGLDIGYDNIRKAYDLYWQNSTSDDLSAIREIDARMVFKNSDGKDCLENEIVWRMSSPAKIKKMYFGRSYSSSHFKMIAEAMQNKTAFTTSARTGYDVKFQYNPEQNRAYYSEEYKNCGNGHYYLALNSTHALFYEDD